MAKQSRVEPPLAELDPFDALPDPAAILDPEGALVRANAAFHAAFRFTITPQRPPWGRVRPPPFERGERVFEAASPDGRRFEWRERLLADGVRLALARDVTDRVAAAEEAARAKTTLFATLTHELRTPLNGILGVTGLLARTPLDANQRAYLGAVRESGEHLLDLITEILDYSRLEAGRLVLESECFAPEAVAQSVAELLSPRAHAKGLDLIAAARADCPMEVVGDEGRLRQILFNLAGNAVKFTERGGVLVEIAPARAAPDARLWLRFAVRDTGPGVPLDMQAAIFEEFQQADASHARRYGGTGLGLAIVKRLAYAMGGRVGLESRPGAGATFWVDLPFGASPHDAAPSRPLMGAGVRVVAASPILQRGLRLMIDGLGGRLVDNGESVRLVDHAHLSEVDARGAPVVALIPQEERDSVEPVRARGVQHYVMKPIRRASLAERLRLAQLGRDASSEDERLAARAPLGLRLLLAEDNPVNALLARTLLSRAGCIVDVVGDGEHAVVEAAKGGYDAILLDLRMPLLDGFTAARRIRALPGAAGSVAILAVTADSGEAERAAARAAGMDAFITKPIDPLRLESVLARLSQRAKPSTLDSAFSAG